jgi:hypothetical protein
VVANRMVLFVIPLAVASLILRLTVLKGEAGSKVTESNGAT